MKTRTGWDRENRNAVSIARIAEQEGIAAIAVHGRTRNEFFQGEAEYETVAAVKQSVRIPVFVNGDIDCAAKALKALELSGADGVMIGARRKAGPGSSAMRAGLLVRTPRRLARRGTCYLLATEALTRHGERKVSAWRANSSVYAVFIRRSDTCQPGC